MGLKVIRTAMLGVAAIALGAVTTAASAAETTLTGVHNCCNSCKKGIDAAVTGAGATAKIDKSTITVSAADDAVVKKAVDALLAAGYYGEGAPAVPAPSDAKAKSVTVESIHLCCGKCVDGFNKAVKALPGVTKTDAVKNAKTVTVEGNVSPKDILDALHLAGFNAMVK